VASASSSAGGAGAGGALVSAAMAPKVFRATRTHRAQQAVTFITQGSKILPRSDVSVILSRLSA
jgi:hypothetical protein